MTEPIIQQSMNEYVAQAEQNKFIVINQLKSVKFPITGTLLSILLYQTLEVCKVSSVDA